MRAQKPLPLYPTLFAGVILGGIIGGITAALLRDPDRRERLKTAVVTVDEHSFNLRSYLTKKITAFGTAAEKELKAAVRKTADRTDLPRIRAD